MKLLVTTIILLTVTIYSQDIRNISLTKNNQGGFNIYNNAGELVYEYTKQNCDSTTLEILSDIYYESDKTNRQQVAVINLQEKGFDFNILIVSLSTLAGIFLGWILNRRSVKHQTLLQNKKEWLDKFRNQASKSLTLLNGINNNAYNIETITPVGKESNLILDSSINYLKENSDKVIESNLNLSFLLDNNIDKQLELSNALITYSTLVSTNKRDYKKAVAMHQTIIDMIKEIVKDEQQKLNTGKLFRV